MDAKSGPIHWIILFAWWSVSRQREMELFSHHPVFYKRTVPKGSCVLAFRHGDPRWPPLWCRDAGARAPMKVKWPVSSLADYPLLSCVSMPWCSPRGAIVITSPCQKLMASCDRTICYWSVLSTFSVIYASTCPQNWYLGTPQLWDKDPIRTHFPVK